MPRFFILAFALLAAFYFSSATSPTTQIAPNPPPSKAAMLVARNMPRLQLSREKLNASTATNALDIFINALDYDHCYFLAADITEFKQLLPKLDSRLEDGDVSPAFTIFNRFKDRVANRVAYTEQLLKQGVDLTTHETYTWKRKNAPWPATDEEWNDLWRRKLKNEYVGREVSRTLAKEKKSATAKTVSTNAPASTPVPAVPKPDDLRANDPTKPESDIEDQTDLKLTTADSILKRYRQFLTTLNDNDSEWLVQRYLCGFTQAYDPHSDYLSPSGLEDFDISMKLSLCGIGALLTSDDGAAKIERLIPGGPAERDGRLKAGDKIIAVAQSNQPPVDILHWPLSKAVRIIRGAKNTTVVLTIIPASDVSGASTRKVDLLRDEVKLEEQAAKGVVREVNSDQSRPLKLGIVTLPEFYADFKAQQDGSQNARRAAQDVRRILIDISTQNVDGIVLDLRNNGGGSLAEAVDIAGEFFPSGPVVQVRQRNETQVLNDTDSETVYAGPLVVLVNRQSASASEIVAGALQDYGRAVIVGDSKTHGKGTVQTMVDLTNGRQNYGALKVTTAGFFRINGGSTQLKGVTPDIVVSSIQDVMEVGEEYLPHAMTWSTVPAVDYPRSPILGPLIPELRKRSETRQTQDPQFAAHRKLIQRFSDRLRSTEISLNFDDRLTMAREDQELEQFRQKEEQKDDKKDDKNDLILNEGLRILTDLITIRSTASQPKLTQGK